MYTASFGPMKDSSQNVTLDTEQVYEHYDNGDILPAIIVMCSSAFAVYKVSCMFYYTCTYIFTKHNQCAKMTEFMF